MTTRGRCSTDVLSTPTGILKLVELVLVVIAIGVLQAIPVHLGGPEDVATPFFCAGVLILGLYVSTLLFVCYLFGYTQIKDTIFEMFFNASMSILILCAGSLIINKSIGQTGDCKSAGNTAGSFCILACPVYAVDAYFAYRNLQ
ncbi:uncharacterized protein LOC143033013 [Oratosquilla oratoria]|uniref:uncharacterized protein LOC143033013 n=1 Tax=Oratosquilla oratoria TaxID=337810 RepID=UPI003F75E6D1